MANNRVPINYQTPPFPALYNPLPNHSPQVYYLYYTRDIWRFTLYWTFIFYAASHLAVAGCAMILQCRNWRVFLAVPLVFIVIGGLEALVAGSIIGVMYVVLIA